MVLGAKVLSAVPGTNNVSAEDIPRDGGAGAPPPDHPELRGRGEGVDSDTIVARAVESSERLAVRGKKIFLR